ncbi:MAG: bifunctional glycosyltransferase family 2 protein/CDP-glycerol:glycerophosphate glycerophosphotransferase [Lachnospiraceae bacterium]|nr:bifunctional glycosyltransferase family 2 protein/CDP-glycerol:glycerophosphate glycerophosphotransferase [Lachnospiraceae bacterium]
MISVIVPYKNEENYLRDCIASLAEQTGVDLEIIITGQKDKVVSALSSHGEKLPENLVIEDAPEDFSVAAKRNMGLDRASGEYVFFLDCDDYIMPNTLRTLLDAAKGRREKENTQILARALHHRTWFKKTSTLAELEKDASLLLSDSDDFDDGNYDRTDLLPGILNDAEANLDLLAEKSRKSPVHGAASVSGILIPRKLITDHGELRFNENYRYYSDLPFVAELAGENGIISCEGADYFKRSHDDPIRMPALCQEEKKEKQLEFIASFNDALAVAGIKSTGTNAAMTNAVGANASAQYLSQYLCAYLMRHLTYTQHPDGLNWSDAEYKGFSELLKKIADSAIDAYKGARRSILIKIKNGSFASAKKKAVFLGKRRKKKGLFGNAQQWSWQFYKQIFRRMSVKKNYYLFESFLGKGYGDSPRYIYEYLLKNKPEGFKPVWIVNDKSLQLPGNPTRVKYMSLRYFYYVARAGVWVTNMRQPAWYQKRKGVKLLECWHGTPLKRLVFDMEDVHSASPKYKSIFYKQSRMWDYLISDNAFSTECFKSAFLFPEEKILQLGYPRNDLLFGDDLAERAQKIRERLGLPLDKKLVLYAPTWRDDEFYSQGEYRFSLPLDLGLMKELSGEYHFLLRTHYFIADNLKLSEEEKSFVTDLSRYNDIGELYLIADVLITDYSSVFFDYANLKRPILFYVYDFEKYQNVLRGFYFDMTSECPGPLLRSSEEVAEALKNIDSVSQEYAGKYEAFCEKYCSLDDGHAAERVVKAVFGGKEFEKNT